LNTETKFTESIKLATKLTVNEKLDTFVLSHSDMQTTTEGENIPGNSLMASLNVANTALDMSKQTVKVSGLQFKSKM